MKLKNIPAFLQKRAKNIQNKNERISTNIVKSLPTSAFDYSSRHLTTIDSGKLVPILTEEILPGDIINLDINTLIKLSTPQAPTMESATYDIAAYIVPNRVIWEEFPYFMGENKEAGPQKDFKVIPTITYNNNFSYKEGDLAAYMGIPINVNMSYAEIKLNSLYFKAYGKIWNDFYRDQNLQSEIDIWNNGKPNNNVITSDYVGLAYNSTIQIGQGLAPVSKFPDYFTTALPYTQKGDTVKIPLGEYAPIVNNYLGSGKKQFEKAPNQNLLIKYGNKSISGRTVPLAGTYVGEDYYTHRGAILPAADITQVPETAETSYVADLRALNGVSVNDLRLAITLQHLRELEARGGTRYTEILYNQWGIKSSDSRLQRSEYIGGFKNNIDIQTVIQTYGAGTGNNPLGAQGGYSVSGGSTPQTIQYAAEEHSILIVVCCIRPNINYSQGIEKKFTKTEKLDYYNPQFANIGEQPILKQELKLSEVPAENTAIWGFNEPWAEYRYSLNKLSGYISPNSKTSLINLYAYSQNYKSSPTLSADWIECKTDIIGSTLLLDGTKVEYIHQFLTDFYFKFELTRRLPLYGIPGVNKI